MAIVPAVHVRSLGQNSSAQIHILGCSSHPVAVCFVAAYLAENRINVDEKHIWFSAQKMMSEWRPPSED